MYLSSWISVCMIKHITSRITNLWPSSINGLSSGLRAPSAHNAVTSNPAVIKSIPKWRQNAKSVRNFPSHDCFYRQHNRNDNYLLKNVISFESVWYPSRVPSPNHAESNELMRCYKARQHANHVCTHYREKLLKVSERYRWGGRVEFGENIYLYY